MAIFNYSLAEITRLTDHLSVERFNTYLAECNNVPLDALKRYEWNTRLSESFYSPLQGLEIAIRNAIHEVLTNDISADWYDHINLQRVQQSQLSKAKDDLNRENKPHDPDRVVAALSFGFWTGILARNYNSLWMQNIHKAFPGCQRRQIQQSLDRLRKLRNRIAHHEPILKRNLQADHVLILNIIGYVNADMKNWVEFNSRFDFVFNNP